MKPNPAGIILIAAGVLLLNLAYTGRAQKVWGALRGKEGADSGDEADEGNNREVDTENREQSDEGDTVSESTRRNQR